MLRTPILVRRLTKMSADTGQVATAVKSVLEKAAAAAQRSGKSTKVCIDMICDHMMTTYAMSGPPPGHCIINDTWGMPCRVNAVGVRHSYLRPYFLL